MTHPQRCPHFRLIGLALVVLGLTVHPLSAASLDTYNGDRFDDFVRLYQTDFEAVGRFYNLPSSSLRLDRLDQLQEEWQRRLQVVNFDGLDSQARIDYVLLRNFTRAELNDHALARRQLAQIDELLPFRVIIQKFEQARWRMENVDPPSAATQVSALPDQLKALRKRIEKEKPDKKSKPTESHDDKPKPEGDASAATETKAEDAEPTEKRPPIKLSPIQAHRAATAVKNWRDSLKTWFTFYDGYQPDFSWWLKKPYDDAQTALEEYAKFLREDIAGQKGKDEDPLIGESIGREALMEALATEMIAYTPEELISIGEREFTWCEARMKEAAKELGLGDDWKAALAKVKSGYVPPGQQDEWVSQQAREAIQFVKQRDLITVPPLAEETWRLSMISASGQKTMPFAAYGGQSMMVAYPTHDMKHEDKLMSMRGNNRHFTRIVTAHELIPGHHLQAFMAARQRAYRALFSTPFFVEGWALNWEMRLWDLNYGSTPEDRIGMLFWRMHRCARIVVSLKFHLNQMKPSEMVDFLVDRVGHERFGAMSEVRRFIGGAYSPLYQCGYMIGGLQLRALHQELVGAGKMTEKQFHDAVLTYGPIPIELVRAGLTGNLLARETQAQWKFAEGN